VGDVLLDVNLTGTVLLITGTHISVRRVRFKGRLFHVRIKMTIWLGSPPPPLPREFALPLRYFKLPLAVHLVDMSRKN
jgi:hypothetical protein